MMSDMSLRKLRAVLGSGLLLLLVGVLGACHRDPKAASRRYVEKGDKYYARNKYKEASIMYRRALQEDMKNADAYYKLGLVDLREKRFSEAAHSLQRAVQINPKNTDGVSKLADLYFASYIQNPPQRQPELEEVKSLDATLLKQDANSYDGLRLKGYLALTEQKLPEAIAALEAADKVKPNQPDLVATLCQALVANKQADEAEAAAKRLIASRPEYGPIYDFLAKYYARSGRAADAEQVLRLKCKNNPKNGDYLAELAAFFLATKQTEKETAAINQLTGSVQTIPDAYLIAGNFYLRTRRPDAALAEYHKGESAQPDRQGVYWMAEAQALAGMGKPDEAAKLVDRIIQKDAKNTDAIVMRAELRMRKNTLADVDSAISDLQGVLAKQSDASDLAQIHFSLGRAYLLKYQMQRRSASKPGLLADLDQARIQMEQAIQVAKEKQGIRFTAAQIGLAQAAIYRDEPARAAQLMTDVLSNEPGNLSALMLRSSAEIAMRKYDDARKDLETILKARPADRDATYQLAAVNFLDGKYAAADEGYEALMKAGDERGLAGLVDSKDRQGKYQEAIQLLQGALAKGKNTDPYRFMLANTQAMAGQYVPAIENYKQLIASNPKAEDLYLRLAEAELRAGQTEPGIEALKKARELSPNSTSAPLRLAIVYQSLGREEEARQQYEAVLKVDPNQAVALNNLAYMSAESGGDLDQALTMAQRASQQLPDNLEIKDTLAYIYTRKGLTEQGLQMFQDLVAKAPDSPRFRIHLAMALLQKGDKTSARRELDTAMGKKPSADEQRRIKELMAKAS
jgi:tetratricopeptide (TPR) repeat protein